MCKSLLGNVSMSESRVWMFVSAYMGVCHSLLEGLCVCVCVCVYVCGCVGVCVYGGREIKLPNSKT